MAQQNRKRRADEASQSYPPAKRQHADDKSSITSSSYSCSRFFPAPTFWDNLSKVLLTRWGLRELDRRDNDNPPKAAAPAVHTTDLARFARHGGPDLRHLRGYPGPNVSDAMGSNRSSGSGSRPTPSKSSAYNPQFEAHLIDHGVYLEGYEYPGDRSTPEPGNQPHQNLSAARSSLSPSRFSESKFRDFKRKDTRANFENDVMATVVPIICGDADIPSRQNVLFTELAPVTSTYDDVVRPKPDFFDGAQIGDIDKKVRDPKGDMYPLIIPTKHASVPVAPNFFLEVKAPKGAADVLKRQACYDGAYGARAMHALQNYGNEKPTYDGNAYTYSSTYYAGTLKLYAHHLTRPTEPAGRPEYHMTQVRAFAMTSDLETFVRGATAFRNARDWAQRNRNSFIQAANAKARQSAVEAPPESETTISAWAMTGNIDSFRQGATAFRNTRDLAQKHRDSFIQAANAKARQSAVEAPPQPEATVAPAEQYEDSTAEESVDCLDYADSQAIGAEDYAAFQDVGEGPAFPEYLHEEEEEPSPQFTSLGAGPAMGFATGVPSSLTSQSRTSSKRNRGSPPSSRPRKKHDLAKKRTR